MKMNKSYSELSYLTTFEERFEYLKLDGGVGRATFGFDRQINQDFYTSREWESVRNYVIVRDQGCDLGVIGYEIHIGPLVHHMNPMVLNDILHKEDWILDPEFLILTTHRTHNDIHFGVKSLLPKIVTERSPRDTRLW
jgi:hypothetical protein